MYNCFNKFIAYLFTFLLSVEKPHIEFLEINFRKTSSWQNLTLISIAMHSNAHNCSLNFTSAFLLLLYKYRNDKVISARRCYPDEKN